MDSVLRSPDIFLHLTSVRGQLAFERRYNTGMVPFHLEHHEWHPGFSDDDSGRRPNGLWFQVLTYSPPTQTYFLVPLWFPILLLAAAAALPWAHWLTRFSLRTLLIATTLVAALLGLIAWHH
jgi:hypothetical protein